MPEHDLLRRIDAHMARGNELMEQNRTAFEANRVAFEANRTAFQENRTAFEDLRTFMRELTLRQEKVMREMSLRQEKVLGGHENVIREMLGELREQRQMLQEGRREFIEESRAQRAALFRVLDRLGGGDSPATT